MPYKFNPFTGTFDDSTTGPQGATGTVSAAGSGTAALPGIAFASDPNTGIYSPGADQVAISTNGTERMRLTSAGLVGIGTSAPWSKLTIGSGGTANPAADATIHDSNASTYRLKLTSTVFNSNGNWLGLGFGYSDNYMKAGILAECKDGNGLANLHFCLNNTANNSNASLSDSRMVVTSGGNVGIGTTSPAYTFDCRGTVYSSVASGTANYLLGDSTNGTQSSIRTSNKNLIFSNDGSNEHARIDSSGRLLVGTSSDSGGAVFQVNGDRIRVGTAKTPASASATGTAGEICWDANYIYVCTATNTWKRTAIATW